MALTFRALGLAGVLAGSTLIAAPASAAPLPAGLALGAPSAAFDFSRYYPASGAAEWGCRWGCGWGWGWGRGGGWGRRGWRRNRIDAGDVLIGAAIIGGIAAIANSNNRRQRERERDVVIVERDPYVRDRNWDTRDDRRDDRRAGLRGTGSSGLDNAVSMCLDRIERDVRVDTVDNVERNGAGWRVSGALFNGSNFQCRIGNNGQIDAIDYGSGFSDIGYNGSPDSALPRADGQLSDQRYADARAAVGGTIRPDMTAGDSVALAERAPPRSAAASSQMPAYPGGPIPGEVIPEAIDGDL